MTNLDLLQDPAIRAQVHRLLVGAREVIAVPERFTRGWYARTPMGNACPITDPLATCWCSVGALRLVRERKRYPSWIVDIAENLLVQKSGMHAGGTFFAPISDSFPHADVLAIFDAAIAETAP